MDKKINFDKVEALPIYQDTLEFMLENMETSHKVVAAFHDQFGADPIICYGNKNGSYYVGDVLINGEVLHANLPMTGDAGIKETPYSWVVYRNGEVKEGVIYRSVSANGEIDRMPVSRYTHISPVLHRYHYDLIIDSDSALGQLHNNADIKSVYVKPGRWVTKTPIMVLDNVALIEGEGGSIISFEPDGTTDGDATAPLSALYSNSADSPTRINELTVNIVLEGKGSNIAGFSGFRHIESCTVVVDAAYNSESETTEVAAYFACSSLKKSRALINVKVGSSEGTRSFKGFLQCADLLKCDVEMNGITGSESAVTMMTAFDKCDALTQCHAVMTAEEGTTVATGLSSSLRISDSSISISVLSDVGIGYGVRNCGSMVNTSVTISSAHPSKEARHLGITGSSCLINCNVTARGKLSMFTAYDGCEYVNGCEATIATSDTNKGYENCYCVSGCNATLVRGKYSFLTTTTTPQIDTLRDISSSNTGNIASTGGGGTGGGTGGTGSSGSTAIANKLNPNLSSPTYVKYLPSITGNLTNKTLSAVRPMTFSTMNATINTSAYSSSYPGTTDEESPGCSDTYEGGWNTTTYTGVRI